MFSTFKQKLLLIAYIIIILSIPVGTYLVSQYQNLKSKAAEPKTNLPLTKVSPAPKSADQPGQLNSTLKDLLKASPQPEGSSSPTIATSFGPTLSLKVLPQGRPRDNQSTKLFVGIFEGSVSLNPRFLLSFIIDVPQSGEYSDLSLAGLSSGSSYTAILKGSAQIATSSAFIMSPTETKLNKGQAIILTTGDLNEDNAINTADYSIAQKAFGTTALSQNWNENADFNKDGVVNIFDVAIITKNLGKVGDSGSWISPLPKSATPSASLTSPDSVPAIGSPDQSQGYWLWIPK